MSNEQSGQRAAEKIKDDLVLKAQSGANASQALNEEALFRQLGERIDILQSRPELTSEFDPKIPANYARRPTKDDAIELGRRVYVRWHRELYRFLCENDELNQSDRNRLFKALVGKEATSAAMIASLLVSSFGLSPAIAAIVGALVLRLFVASAGQTVCEFWKETLDRK